MFSVLTAYLLTAIEWSTSITSKKTNANNMFPSKGIYNDFPDGDTKKSKKVFIESRGINKMTILVTTILASIGVSERDSKIALQISDKML